MRLTLMGRSSEQRAIEFWENYLKENKNTNPDVSRV